MQICRVVGWSFMLWVVAACTSSNSSDGEKESTVKRQSDASADDAKDVGSEPAMSGAAGGLALPVPVQLDFGCDMTSQVSHCGDVECPTPPETPAGTCGVVVCCTPDDKCGLRSASTLDGKPASNLCLLVGVPDARCPEVAFGAASLPGCCDVAGRCGQLLGTLCGSIPDAMACDAESDM